MDMEISEIDGYERITDMMVMSAVSVDIRELTHNSIFSRKFITKPKKIEFFWDCRGISQIFAAAPIGAASNL